MQVYSLADQLPIAVCRGDRCLAGRSVEAFFLLVEHGNREREFRVDYGLP